MQMMEKTPKQSKTSKLRLLFRARETVNLKSIKCPACQPPFQMFALEIWDPAGSCFQTFFRSLSQMEDRCYPSAIAFLNGFQVFLVTLFLLSKLFFLVVNTAGFVANTVIFGVNFSVLVVSTSGFIVNTAFFVVDTAIFMVNSAALSVNTVVFIVNTAIFVTIAALCVATLKVVNRRWIIARCYCQ